MTNLIQPIRQCAWCCRVVDQSGRYGSVAMRKIKSATHGICPTCKEIVRAEFDGRRATSRLAA
jgi:hypothetical protein